MNSTSKQIKSRPTTIISLPQNLGFNRRFLNEVTKASHFFRDRIDLRRQTDGDVSDLAVNLSAGMIKESTVPISRANFQLRGLIV